MVGFFNFFSFFSFFNFFDFFNFFWDGHRGVRAPCDSVLFRNQDAKIPPSWFLNKTEFRPHLNSVLFRNQDARIPASCFLNKSECHGRFFSIFSVFSVFSIFSIFSEMATEGSERHGIQWPYDETGSWGFCGLDNQTTTSYLETRKLSHVIYVCMYVCIYCNVMYACMYMCMRCMHTRMYVRYLCMYVMYVMHLCNACRACMFVICMYVCM